MKLPYRAVRFVWYWCRTVGNAGIRTDSTAEGSGLDGGKATYRAVV